MFAIKLTLLLAGVMLYLITSVIWFFWIGPDLFQTGTEKALLGLLGGTAAWMLITFGVIIHIIKTARPTAAGGR